jgi:hypothetical protein
VSISPLSRAPWIQADNHHTDEIKMDDPGAPALDPEVATWEFTGR